MSNHPAQVSRPSWGSVLLVCKACRKRAKLPATLKSKAVASAIRRELADEKRRPRVLLSSCLGLCPKSALAMACVSERGAASIAAVQSPSQVVPTARALLDTGAS